MIRILVIGPEEREAAHRLAEFAAQPVNHYIPQPGAKIPGDNPRFVLKLNDYRCVFTYTSAQGLRRHLSISVPRTVGLPNPAAVEEIARLFGFKGKLSDFGVHVDHKTRSVVVLQKIA